jgi:4-amino-4-deoxy-L-arabinose transferase-like glycosyltransferase
MIKQSLLIPAALFLSVLTVWVVTLYAPGAASDTISYYAFAHSGQLHDLPVHHGIFYAWLLGAIVRLGLSIENAVRLVNILAGTGILLVSSVILSSGKSVINRWAMVAFLLLMLMNYPVLQSLGYAMTEALFLFEVLAMISCLILYHERRQDRWLVIGGVFGSLACLTRFAGLPFVAAGSLILLRYPGSTKFACWVKAIMFGAASLVPLTLVAWWNAYRHGSAANREVGFRWIPADTIEEAAMTMASWLAPYRLLMAVDWLSPFIVLLILMAVILIISTKWGEKRLVAHSLAVVLALYLLFLAISIMLADVSIMLDHRMLAPVASLLLLIGSVLFCDFYNSAGKRLRFLMLLAAVYLLSFTAYRASSYMSDVSQNGQGFTSRVWKESELVNIVNGLSLNNIKVYSNASDALALLRIGGVVGIPALERPTSLRPLDGAHDRYVIMVEELAAGDAVLAQIDLRYWPPYLPAVDTIVFDSGLQKLEYADGCLFMSEPIIQKIQSIIHFNH